MSSIQKLWENFDIENGLIDQDHFKSIMTQVAADQGLYDGNEQDIEQATIFFTNENLENIFHQIL